MPSPPESATRALPGAGTSSMDDERRVNGGKNASSSLVPSIASPRASSFSSGRSSGFPSKKNVSIARSRWHLRVSRVAAGSESRAASRSALTEKRAKSTTASGFHALATRAARRYSKTASPPAVTMVCGGSINVGLSSHSSRFSAVSDESHPPRRRKRLPDATSLERRRHRASDGGSFLMALREQSSDSRLANLPSAEGSAVSWLWLTSSARSRSGWNARHKPGGRGAGSGTPTSRPSRTKKTTTSSRRRFRKRRTSCTSAVPRR